MPCARWMRLDAWACFGRVWDARVCPKLVRNYPFTPQKIKFVWKAQAEERALPAFVENGNAHRKGRICVGNVGCLHEICVDFDEFGGGKNGINGFPACQG
ncbi:hypothetical protein PMAC_003401 [Pneumocystis sp. 'macacae']|nr:hypothetical protein PMAC_003401 [Pneumocystis sp. 'macacae']